MNKNEFARYQKDFKKIISLTPIKNGDAVVDEMVIKTNGGNIVGPCLVQEGDNGATHGMKGHRKAYLSFNFNKQGVLIDVQVYVPSINENFTFIQNATEEF